jgi:hypothetical protein
MSSNANWVVSSSNANWVVSIKRDDGKSLSYTAVIKNKDGGEREIQILPLVKPQKRHV